MDTACQRVWLAVGGILLVAAGCTQTQDVSPPGALPTYQVGANAPRIRATTYFAHGHLLERQGDFERAVVQYGRALELKPDFVAARNRLGITLNKLGHHAKASAEFRRAIGYQPQLAYLHNNLGFSLYLEGKYTEAEAATRRALEITPAFPRGRMNHALALAKLGRFDEAFGELRQVGTEADAYYNLAMLQTEAQRYADAARALGMALRLNPRLEAARQQLREIAVLAARQETVPVADLATTPDGDSPPEPAADSPPVDARARVKAAIQTAAVETAGGVEPPATAAPEQPVLAESPADAERPRVAPAPAPVVFPAEAEATEPSPTPEPFEPFPELEADVFDWFADAAPTAEPEWPLGADAPELVPEPGDVDIEPEPQGDAMPRSASEPLSGLIAAIVDRSEELVAELWCELESAWEAARRTPATEPADPAD